MTFLRFLFYELKLQPPTLATYKSALKLSLVNGFNIDLSDGFFHGHSFGRSPATTQTPQTIILVPV